MAVTPLCCPSVGHFSPWIHTRYFSSTVALFYLLFPHTNSVTYTNATKGSSANELSGVAKVQEGALIITGKLKTATINKNYSSQNRAEWVIYTQLRCDMFSYVQLQTRYEHIGEFTPTIILFSSPNQHHWSADGLTERSRSIAASRSNSMWANNDTKRTKKVAEFLGHPKGTALWLVISTFWMDFLEILYKISWLPNVVSEWLWWSSDFSIKVLIGSNYVQNFSRIPAKLITFPSTSTVLLCKLQLNSKC